MGVHHLSIDIETYCSVNIGKSGLYKYVQSPDFQILLFAYSLDAGPVQVVDLTKTSFIPPEIMLHMFDPNTIKHAYNAPFEWYCLSKHFGLFGNLNYPPEAWLSQWRCTMLHGLYCGYPAGLDACGKALGLPQDKQKLSTGKALIRYFCVPCFPSKANGGRTKNLPHHDPGKWGLFIEYCRQDVVTEMEIESRLYNFRVPDQVQHDWQIDQVINTRGVAVDMGLVEGALWCGDTTKEALVKEAVALTGLDNPNSIQQLTKWLEQETGEEITDLRKDTVSQMLGRDMASETAKRILEIRQELGKTSTKKFNALATAICDDGRVRGLLQFYGANRTGRWAGRIVQPQNLPRTYIEPLPLARELVQGRQLDALRLIYGSIPDTLSQLIRTAFVAAPGNILIDADFSAIEARVIAWLAGEQWRLDVFRTHGKIYEASASQMFGVPLDLIKKGNPEYALRQKGKVAELALGYQGGPGALISMGALNMGLTEEELPDIVRRWRNSNKRIVDLWYSVEAAANETVQAGRMCCTHGLTFTREQDPGNSLDFLTITLPSGRQLFYAKPHIGLNRFDKPSISYWGMDQTSKQWKVLETYGGKLVENVVQAIARDCLAEAIRRLEIEGFPVAFHVHDEVVIDHQKERANLDRVVEIMSQPMPWATDLPLGADGWVNPFFKKD